MKNTKNNADENFEILRKKLYEYKDVLDDVFGNYVLTLTTDGNIYLLTRDGIKYKYIIDKDTDKIKFLNRKKFNCDEITIFKAEDKVAVAERKINFHQKGACVECLDRIYGKTSKSSSKNELLDLRSINYVIDDREFYSLADLFDQEFVRSSSKLTTEFSVHMKYLYRTKNEIRPFSSTIYPTHVYFNHEDISHVFEYVYGENKVKRVYNLYKGNLKKDSSDTRMLITGLVDEDSFNYQNKKISAEVESLIGKPINIDNNAKEIEEYINSQLNYQAHSTEKIQVKDKSTEKIESTKIEENPKCFIKRLFTRKK